MHSVPLFYPFCVSCIMTGQTGQTFLSVPAVCNKAADVRFTRLTVKIVFSPNYAIQINEIQR